MFSFSRSTRRSSELFLVRRFDPAENSFAVHQRVRVAIDRLNSTDKIGEMCNQV